MKNERNGTKHTCAQGGGESGMSGVKRRKKRGKERKRERGNRAQMNEGW